MSKFQLITILLLVANMYAPQAQNTPQGFNDVPWGSTPEEVQQIAQIPQWQPDPVADEFPQQMEIEVFSVDNEVAGYPANVRYYFYQQQFFQATVVFEFEELENFDYNFNVYRSVNEYYNAIRNTSLLFTQDIYSLLRKKYGKRKPIFRGLDPRLAFTRLDAYLRQEQWNLRYHPYAFYQRIVTAAYARWDFPKTRVIFSINIAAPQQRFDYKLSAVSLDLEREVNRQMDLIRMQGL
ncbi:hypothetical protein QA601_12720 [Chitinispirillales bacterium ANBcel5]|uniref:hypothetical protein n=1 Tax=Cellulosispirillum alkaliphilum TaxID=3039283 RepID=UPI002A597C61|nr:hypothetical protein [Chitinispirillales bacterium ANBcel5]